jgi:uncharacterized repeat protein (TIGR03803 family)
MRRRHFLLNLAALMLVALVCVTCSQSQTVTFKGLHEFSGGSDGAYPNTPLTFDRVGNLYGATYSGGTGTACSGGCGTLFELIPSTSGLKERVLYSFPAFTSTTGPLVLDAKGNVFGTTPQGGNSSCNCGEVYQVARSGNGRTQSIIYSFLGGTSDGEYPEFGLVQDTAGNLYGSTQIGGLNNGGIVFELTPNGDGTWTESVIHAFGNSQDGSNPYGPLAIDTSGNLYGTTGNGGLYGPGIVFKLTPSGGSWTETILYNFTMDFGSYPQPEGVALDGAGNLYGATIFGGEYGVGTLYSLTPTVGYWHRTVLHTFTGANDGAYPYGGLTIGPTGLLYGTAASGGLYGFGTVYKLVKGANGRWNDTVLHTFKGTDGSGPTLGVVLDQLGNLYGVASGGTYGFGVAFQITP